MTHYKHKENSKEPVDMTDRVFECISENDVRPISKEVFLLKNLLWWVLLAFFLLLAIFTVAASAYRLGSLGQLWKCFPFSGKMMLIRDSVPVLWMFLLSFALIFSLYALRHTEKGYKLAKRFILSGFLFSILVSGVALSRGGAGESFDKLAAGRMPFHPQIESIKNKVWQVPVQGRLSGKFVNLDGNKMTLVTTQEKEWVVDVSALAQGEIKLVRSLPQVYVIGEMSDGTFMATEVRPFADSGIRTMSPLDAVSAKQFIEYTYGIDLGDIESERILKWMRSNKCEDARTRTLPTKSSTEVSVFTEINSLSMNNIHVYEKDNRIYRTTARQIWFQS